MKHTLLSALALLAILSRQGQAQSTTSATTSTENPPVSPPVYTYVEQMPVFPGGQESLLRTIGETVDYPTAALQQRLEGRVFVQFVVGTTGKVQDVRVSKSLHPLLDAAAIQAVSTLPEFSPGRQVGRAVPVAFTLPVTFKLPPNVEEILAARAVMSSPASASAEFARYPGGPEALAAYLSAVPYPEAARPTQTEGRVYVHFLVSATGKIEQVAAIVPPKAPQRRKSAIAAPAAFRQTSDPILLKTAEQRVTDMPAWTPAMLNGKAVSTTQTVFMDFYATAPATTATPVYAYADQMPVVGGSTEKYPFPSNIYQGIRYPVEALRRQVQGEVLVYFVVDEQGQVTQAQVIRSVDPTLDAEALRVISSLPAGTPAMHQGKPVKVFFTAPVNFAIR